MASTNTSIMFTEVRLGLIPATIAPYVVQKVGKSVAMEWMLSGRLIDSEEAWQIASQLGRLDMLVAAIPAESIPFILLIIEVSVKLGAFTLTLVKRIPAYA